MTLFPKFESDAIFISRKDPDELLGTYSNHPIELDGLVWPTVEHYYQAMKFQNLDYKEKIRLSNTPNQAHKLGNAWFKKKVSNWKNIERTVMNRGMYIKAKTYLAVQNKLIESGTKQIAESSQYDYFWGIGRDKRGDNHFGKILQNIRTKLIDERNSLP